MKNHYQALSRLCNDQERKQIDEALAKEEKFYNQETKQIEEQHAK